MSREVDEQTLADLSTFSEPAKSTIGAFIFDYACNLSRAAVTVKVRDRGDSVSAANVQEAYFHLNKQEQNERKGYLKLAGVLGGIFFGTGISTLASMIQSNEFTRGGTIISVLAGAVGAFLIALDLAEGMLWRKRKSPNPG